MWQAQEMVFWAYLLRCGDGSYYAGHTDDLPSRIGSHQAGRGGDYTARRLPITLVWSQEFPTRIEALEGERRIKGWSRAKKEALIAGDWAALPQLARSHGSRPSTSSGRTQVSAAAGSRS
ncbi:putative GIY-YIG superfamily endonuclease [Sphingomonas endophytica]|uniref:Putative GIY-YIG superfamily endonuclease n=1 Tax=Sphingomonas endophytica TaxID=869719 RepID=A0A7X0JFF6_9SPHN|nr:GIY-YIG nuclease family protein [Sphingomonas endophytica]MBB6506280.1 putative GIY-YIG superfamily endonuclease [Sphingomonas endophytica]